ncbi:MAG: hypothetical protein IJE40_04570 [Clostridia bacterium]|nr:hypothetical protein [Clostridia bacterium]
MMFFKKRNSYHLPLGILLGTLVGIAGAAALAVSNGEIRKTMGKELKKCCRTGHSMMNKSIFSVK